MNFAWAEPTISHKMHKKTVSNEFMDKYNKPPPTIEIITTDMKIEKLKKIYASLSASSLKPQEMQQSAFEYF